MDDKKSFQAENTMDSKQEDFYKKIRGQISEFLEKKEFKHGDILLLAPDFFHLLIKLSLDPRVSKERKIKVAVVKNRNYKTITL